MHRFIIVITLIATLTGLSGCTDQGASGKGQQTAVMDINAIIQAMDYDDQMGKFMSQVNTQLKESAEAQLNLIAKNMQDQIDAKVTEYGENPTEEQQQELDAMKAQAVQKFKVAQQAFSRDAQQRSQQIQRERSQQIVREQVRPIAKELAEKNGFTMVLYTQNVAYYADAIDITGDVITKLRAAASNTSAPVTETNEPATTESEPATEESSAADSEG